MPSKKHQVKAASVLSFIEDEHSSVSFRMAKDRMTIGNPFRKMQRTYVIVGREKLAQLKAWINTELK